MFDVYILGNVSERGRLACMTELLYSEHGINSSIKSRWATFYRVFVLSALKTGPFAGTNRAAEIFYLLISGLSGTRTV